MKKADEKRSDEKTDEKRPCPEDLIAHYIEAEIREALGETRGCLGWPLLRLKKVKGHLRGLRNALETHRKKWCTEMNEIDVKRRMVNEATVMRLIQSEERRLAFEASWGEARERCQRDLDVGTFTGEVQPIGLRPPEMRGEKRASGERRTEESKEKKTFMRPLEDPPERLGRYSEGGSSGSTEGKKYGEVVFVDAPPVEEPPPMPPREDPPVPAEASAVEVAPSKGEEVRQRIAEAPTRLGTEAYRALEDEFIAVAKPEELRPEDREIYEAVRGTGWGLCARCHWKSGCPSCDEDKAWGFACRSTLWHRADEALRPKAKPKGRPKKQAA